MKIHLISNMYPSEDAPNYGVFVRNTEKILLDAGCQIDRTVLYKETNKYFKLIKYLIYYFLIICKTLIRKYDMLYVHYAAHNAVPVLFLKVICKDLVIYTNVHGTDVVPQIPSQEKYQPYVKKLLKKSTCVITPSNYFKELVKKKYNLNNRIEVFPSGGINSNIFYQRTDRESSFNELGIDSSYKYIGYVSRIDVGKGWEVFLTSLKNLKEEQYFDNNKIKALIVGDGKDKERFENMVNEFGLGEIIVHYPLLPQKKLNAIFNAIDVFCFPTKGESLGLVGLEAMACGTPVIGSSVGGLLDYIIDGENGLLFKVGSSDDLTNKLKNFFTFSEDKRRELSRQAKIKSEEYNLENIKGKLLRIFTFQNNHTRDF
ncbi:glycosyltransferase [Bacillus sp. FJAT-47783]|uniref:glycosyltransferase n=1 Tax=Bacillus sp. FJAT-47783 TaxID=2922712 RepID=UPI001FACC846|nr:glycosyltransferase [Bacillus sp. FJAT-47783]